MERKYSADWTGVVGWTLFNDSRVVDARLQTIAVGTQKGS